MTPEISIILLLVGALAFLWWKWSQLKLQFDSRAGEEARERFARWKATDMESELAKHLECSTAAIKEKAANEIALAKREARMAFEQWKSDETLRIRKDATHRSDAVHRGKVTEHLVPWFLDGAFDPRDIRFIGSPIDLMVFDGLSNGYVDAIRFIEVKTGKTPRLSPREELVRGAALAGRVSYSVVHLRQQDDEVGLRPTWTDEDPTKRLQQIMNQELKTLVEKAAEALEMVELEDAAELQTLIFKTFAKNNAQLADQIAVLRKEVESLKDR